MVTGLEGTAVIWKDNAYVSRCPKTDVASCGDTAEEALRNLREALRETVELYLENAKRPGILREIQEVEGPTLMDTAGRSSSIRECP